MNPETKNAIHLQAEFSWLKKVISMRLDNFSNKELPHVPFELLAEGLPHLNGFDSGYSQYIYKESLAPAERLILLLALAPHIYPSVLTELAQTKHDDGTPLVEIGGMMQKNTAAFLPTAETALFILAGTELQQRLHYMPYFGEEQVLFASKAVDLHSPFPHEPQLNSMLLASRELIESFTSGRPYKPRFGPEFPARKVVTQLDWKDLILEDTTVRQLSDIKSWIQHSDLILNTWGMSNRIKPGYRALFFGPPGTGKTLTAGLLGKEAGRDVYRIDLSTVVSKYIGETEKNLERVFTRAERRNWILFFDEADAIFGKRTKVKDSHDRFANQEVSYLLQRVEDFDGIVILASNDKDNMDDAFSRRFQSMIHFPMPKAKERLRLWQTNFPEACPLEDRVDLRKIAERYEVSGGLIINVVRFCAMEAAKRSTPLILLRDIEEGLRREYQKMRKLM